MSELIYLASPYSHPDKSIRKERYEQVTKVGARLIMEGYHIFGPITESHNYQRVNSSVGHKWDFWKEHDELMMERCDEMWVLCLEGWEQSLGVQAEIKYAKYIGMHINYINQHTYLSYNDLITPSDLVEHPEEFLSCYRVLDYGASLKYEANGWLHSDPVTAKLEHKNNMASIKRHITHVEKIPDAVDPETKLLHAEHAVCRLNMLITRIKRELKL